MNFLAKWRLRKPTQDAQTAYVSERFGVRTLHLGSDTVQSAMRLARPNDLELSYTRSMMAFLLFRDAPADALLIGLGGGSLAKFVYHRLPQTRVRAVEVNPQVVAIARALFHVPLDSERFEVVIADGAAYVERTDVAADVILLDGYDGEAHVEALASRDFYAACRDRLTDEGVLTVNLWGGDRLFTTLLRRIQNAFPAGTLCLPAERPGNVIVFAFKAHPPKLDWSRIEARAQELEDDLGLEFGRFAEGLRKMNRHDTDALYLTPSSSPAPGNLSLNFEM